MNWSTHELLELSSLWSIKARLLGTFDTSLSGRRTRNERKIVKSKGSDDSAVIVTNLNQIVHLSVKYVSHYRQKTKKR